MYEVFDHKWRKRNEGPAVTISKTGKVTLNVVALRLFVLHEIRHVNFLIDRAAGKLAIKKTDDRDRDSWRVTVCGRMSSICAIKVLRSIGYQNQFSQSFDAVWDEKEVMLEIKGLPIKCQ